MIGGISDRIILDDVYRHGRKRRFNSLRLKFAGGGRAVIIPSRTEVGLAERRKPRDESSVVPAP